MEGVGVLFSKTVSNDIEDIGNDEVVDEHFHPFHQVDEHFHPYHPCDSSRWFASYSCQKALCSPSYINLTETETVMRCLELAGRFKTRAENDIDHAEEYHVLREMCVAYATGLLDVCRDDDDDDGDGDDPEEAFDEMDAILGRAKKIVLLKSG